MPCHSLCHSRVRIWSYIVDPFFCAKTESAANPLPRSVIVPSPSDFAANLPEWVQCPVRAIKFLRKAARSASYIPSRLFVSPRNPGRAMSRNAISFSLRPCLHHAPLELMTFVALLRPSIITVISLSYIMQIATWRSIRVFASRYLKEDSSAQDDIRRFGPLGFAGDRLHSRPPQHNH